MTIVILRDKECVTCHTKDHLSPSHWISRRYKATRWDLRNVNCQCIACNGLHDTNKNPYNKWMKENYSEDIIIDLVHRINYLKFTRKDRIDVYNYLVVEGEKYAKRESF